MAKYLIIVESPNKVKHIQEFVGPSYKVMASVGHIRKINDSGKYKIGIDYDDGFKTDWVVDSKKKDIVAELKKAIKDAEIVYLASDDDNEGEAIAWHLRETLKIPKTKLKRAVFKEITKSSVLEGLKNASVINESKAMAAISRAKLDKIMGYRLSPIVTIKTGGKSAGRVQSVALRLVCEKEKEILSFQSKEYYEIYLSFVKDGTEYTAQYKGTDSKKETTISDLNHLEDIKKRHTGNTFTVIDISKNDREVKTKPAFITSSLQQECSNKFGYSPKKTMEYAQYLFENGYITYLRTDSTRLSDEFITAAKDYIEEHYGKEYYSGVKVSKKKQENVQDAHEAIRCVDINKTPQYMKNYGVLKGPELRVYSLIYNRCVASLMSNSVIEDTHITFVEGKEPERFVLTGHKVKFPGFSILYSDTDEDGSFITSTFAVKETVSNDHGLDYVKKKTNPPSRYSEASLIKKLEDLKIGRPSTYATMVSVVTDVKRGYTELDGKTIKPTEKGMRVNEFLDKYFHDIINYNYTAELEEKLDKISSGELNDLDFLNEFYSSFKPLLTCANNAHVERPKAVLSGKMCPDCGRPLAIRKGPYGEFLGCTGFPKCRHIEKIVNESEDDVKVLCPTCKTGYLVQRKATSGKSKGKIFYGCSSYPSCKTAVTKEKYEELREFQKSNPTFIDGDK